jgi:hypothetical protein
MMIDNENGELPNTRGFVLLPRYTRTPVVKARHREREREKKG